MDSDERRRLSTGVYRAGSPPASGNARRSVPYDLIGRFIDEVYACKRIDSSLGYLTPAEFEQRWRTAN